MFFEGRLRGPVRAVATGLVRLLGTSALLGAIASGAASAGTTGAASAGTTGALALFAQAPDRGLANGTSVNWSGYVAESNLAKTTNRVVNNVAGPWVVPNFTCAPTGFTYSSFWVGMDGWTDHTVEQIGTEEDCSYDAYVSYAWYEMYPALPVRVLTPAQPGDLMSADVAYTGDHRFVLAISNLTEGYSFSITQTSNAQRQSAEWIAEAPSSGRTVLPLTSFGSVGFTAANATFGAITGPISDPAWQDDPVTMTDPTGTLKAVPSALDTSGQSFSVTWQHS